MIIASGPVLPDNNSADEVAKQALSWIEECQTSHPSCQISRFPAEYNSTRLIFTGKPGIGLRPRLCNTSELFSKVLYTTLSHCWGSVAIFKLLSTNLSLLLEEIPLVELTQVFRDAIDLTYRLGIDYIWIDSLCIIQDSVEDWEHESAIIGDVYKYSWCNIAATGFENGLAGLFVKRNPYAMQPFPVNIKPHISRQNTSSELVKGP